MIYITPGTVVIYKSHADVKFRMRSNNIQIAYVCEGGGERSPFVDEIFCLGLGKIIITILLGNKYVEMKNRQYRSIS